MGAFVRESSNLVTRMPDEPIQLHYSKARPVWHRRRRVRIALAAVIALVVLGSLWGAWESAPGEWVRFEYWRYRCDHHEARTDLPAYSIDPAMRPKMLAGGNEYLKGMFGRPDVFYIPDDWSQIHQFVIPESTFIDPVAFIHELTPHNGESRLVSVRVESPGRYPAFQERTSTGAVVTGGQIVFDLSLASVVFNQANGHFISEGNTTWTLLLIPSTEHFSLMEGKPDPIDRSRFTIGYKIRGQDGTIVGQLNDDNSVVLRVLDGPLVLFEKDAPFVPRARAGK